MTGRFTLGKQERLKSRKALELLFREGKSFTVFPYRVLYRQVPGELQFGTGVSTRHFKRAVDRNRIKRQTREGYRIRKHLLGEAMNGKEPGLHLFFTFTAKELMDSETLHAGVQKAIDKLIRIVNENNAPHT